MAATRRIRSTRVTLSAAFTALTALVAATGCATDNTPDQALYCADSQRTIRPDRECEGDNPNTFIHVGTYSTSHKVGSKLPTTAGEKKIAAADADARARAGIPARGGFGGRSGSVAG